MLDYIIYCRKSSESEERQVLSIESQIKELKDFAERMNITVSEILTESRSAKEPGRPVFNTLMKRVYKGEIKGVISWKLDRLARNPIDGASLVWALDQEKISEIITPHGTFFNNSNAKLMMQIEFGMAKKYVDDLSDNVKRGNRAKLERGWVPGPPPLGYINDPKEKITISDPERFHLVRQMWDLLLNGTGPTQIQKIANEEWGFRTRQCKKLGKKPLTLSTIYKIFSNPYYYGLIERKEGVFVGKHEPMITENEYWKAQNILGRKGRERSKKHQFAFTGLIRCGECGSMITAEEKDNRFGDHYVYYRCTKKKPDMVCHQSYINLNDLEAQILEWLYKINIPERLLNVALEHLASEGKEKKEKQPDVQKSLISTLADCEKKIANLNRMRIADLINDAEYLKEKKILLTEKIGIEAILKNDDTDQRQSLNLTIEALNFAAHAQTRFQNSDIENKKTILRELGSNFFLRDKKLIIEAEKPLLIIEEGLKRVSNECNRLEPSNFLFIEPINGLSSSQIQSWCTSVEDVRTFFKKSDLPGDLKAAA